MRAFEIIGRSAAMFEPRSRQWLEHVQWFEEIDSTNTFARRWLATDVANERDETDSISPSSAKRKRLPALFVADRQTAGRGRTSNPWWSPSGCLMLTLVVDRDALPSDQREWPKLALICGVAAAEASEQIATELNVQLKWPNDLYASGKKLGGILIESIPPSQPDQSPVWLIGIGLNVRVQWLEAPSGLRERAICLSSACDREFDRERVLSALIAALRRWLEDWKKGNADWRKQWSDRSLLNQRVVEVRIPPDTTFRGRCEGLDQEGRLLIRSERELRSISAGEIIQWSD